MESPCFCFLGNKISIVSWETFVKALRDFLVYVARKWCMPGIGRKGQLRALEYITEKFGPNKAFSSFVAGLEPLESML